MVDQLTALRTLAAREAEVEMSLASAERGYDLSVERYRAGLGNYLQVLATLDRVLIERTQRVQLRAQRLDAQVALIHALGGGYEPAPAH